jgi:hypothetical protein
MSVLPESDSFKVLTAWTVVTFDYFRGCSSVGRARRSQRRGRRFDPGQLHHYYHKLDIIGWTGNLYRINRDVSNQNLVFICKQSKKGCIKHPFLFQLVIKLYKTRRRENYFHSCFLCQALGFCLIRPYHFTVQFQHFT